MMHAHHCGGKIVEKRLRIFIDFECFSIELPALSPLQMPPLSSVHVLQPDFAHNWEVPHPAHHRLPDLRVPTPYSLQPRVTILEMVALIAAVADSTSVLPQLGM
jgi:hypothetical protein